MISEGSCDTEDWSNDTENSALHNSNKLHLQNITKYIKITKKTVILNCNNIYFLLVSIRAFFWKYYYYFLITFWPQSFNRLCMCLELFLDLYI